MPPPRHYLGDIARLNNLSGNDLEESRQDPLGHPPDQQIPVDVCGNDQRLSPNCHRGVATARGIEKVRELDPVRLGDLAVEHQRRPGIEGKDERTHGDGREDWGAWNHVIQGTDMAAPRERKPDLFLSLADGRVEQVRIGGMLAPAGQTDLA